MKQRKLKPTLAGLVLGLVFALTGCGPSPEGDEMVVTSPDGHIRVELSLEDGVPFYSVRYRQQVVLHPSRLGFVFKDAPPLNHDLAATKVEHDAFDETWEQPWGEVRFIRNQYNELRVHLQEQSAPRRRMVVVFRVYDDGLGFRYELPAQENLGAFQIMDEQTEFVLAGDHQAWWIPAFLDRRYEYLYRRSPISTLKKVHTPLTIETADGLFLSLHEANLTDYASMTLVGTGGNTLQCELVPWSDGVKVKATTPHQTPWRTLQIATRAGDLITSYLILNLNEPNVLGDVSWVKPGKYVGMWWAIHLGLYTWGSGPEHGATTANAMRYIDFAAEHGLDGVLVEGWNLGWDGSWLTAKDAFNFSTPYPDFDIGQVARYAQEKGVRLFGHHETGADVENYERQMEDAFAFYEALGVDTVKTGYAGVLVDDREWHHGQYMVRHYRRVVELAAQHGIMLDVHEPIKDTGIRRTYPNMMTREGARGMEYNSKSRDGGNPPEHTTILPFTRMLSGPLDYTPGIFDLLFEESRPNNRVNTTLAKQLALYVVLYSPLQMAADLPENYQGHPAFEFIVAVPVDWQDTRVLDGQIGDYVTVARQDRHSEDWYIGSITDEQGRTLDTPLTFLDPGQQYVAEIYADGADADWVSNPLSFEISRFLVDHETVLKLELAPGGGQAIRLHPASAVDEEIIPVYVCCLE
jgi:alpha-glucosidase